MSGDVLMDPLPPTPNVPKTNRDEELQVNIMRAKGAPQIGAPSPIGPMVVPWRRTKNMPISGMFRVVSCRVVLLPVVFCMFRGTRVVCSRVACRGVFACAACPSSMLRVLHVQRVVCSEPLGASRVVCLHRVAH